MKKLFVALMFFVCASSFAATMKLEPAQQKKLNTFFSNFSESAVPSFTALTDEIMLQFALSHNYINKLKSLKKGKDGMSVLVTPEQVNTTTTKYFGKNLSAHKEKEYSVPMADGEAFTFSQLNTLEDLGNDMFKAEGTIYTTGSGGTPDVHASPDAWKKAGEEVEASAKFSAKIKAEGERYILVEYTVQENQATETTEPATTETAKIDLSVMNTDIFDWQQLNEQGKIDLLNKVKELWRAKGVDPENLDAKAILEKLTLGDQANIFESACKAAGVDPAPFQEMKNK